MSKTRQEVHAPTSPGRGTAPAPAPSGRQFEIAFGAQRATIVEVGAGIRAYRDGRRDVLHPYDVDAMSDGAHGSPLIPWPNRLRDGRYGFDGTDYQLALTEPEKNNAIHGLLRWRPWQAVAHEADHVVMATTLHPMQGYPFTLDVRIEYRLAQDGLTVRTTAANIGDRPAPYGCGQHPYLSPGTGTVDACTLTLDAGTRILTGRRIRRGHGVRLPGRAQDRRSAGRLRLHRSAPGRERPGLGAPARRRRGERAAVGGRDLPGRGDLHR
jgi:aldose 1-epimerase